MMSKTSRKILRLRSMSSVSVNQGRTKHHQQTISCTMKRLNHGLDEEHTQNQKLMRNLSLDKLQKQAMFHTFFMEE